jgi:hypothetical protein
MVLNGNNANNAAQFDLLRSEARGTGIEVLSLDVRKPEDVDAAFVKAAAFGAKALVNAVDSLSIPGASRLRRALRNANCQWSTPTKNMSWQAA